MKKMWGFKLNLYNICMIVLMAVFNILLNLLAQYFNSMNVPMPLWLDSVGTFIAAMEAGPIAGAIAGLPIYGVHVFTHPDWAAYSIISVLIGISAGIVARASGSKTWRSALLAGVIAAVIDTALSSYLDLRFYGGETDFMLGDMVFHALSGSQPPVYASLAAEAAMSVPDKILSAIMAYLICTDYFNKNKRRNRQKKE